MLINGGGEDDDSDIEGEMEMERQSRRRRLHDEVGGGQGPGRESARERVCLCVHTRNLRNNQSAHTQASSHVKLTGGGGEWLLCLAGESTTRQATSNSQIVCIT